MEMIRTAEASAGLLKESVAFYFDFLRRNPQIVRVLAWMFLERDQKDCMDIDSELITRGAEKIKEAQALGQIRADIDPRFIVFVFTGLCQHWFQDKEHFIESYGTEGLGGDLDQAYLDTILKIFFEGILPRNKS